MLVLGLTGGIGSGKSIVAEMFRTLGAKVVSADDLARMIVQPGSPTLARIARRFGAEVLCEGGALNRAWLAKKIFSDPQARLDLDRITHPAIAELARRRFAALAQASATLVVYDAPLLFEAGADTQVDAVVVVSVAEEVQLQRLMLRDGLDEQAARSRMDSQMPLDEKLARADYVIDNNGSLEQTRDQVVALMARLVPGMKGPDPHASGSAG
ncbi:dephospho-coenzyme A kinase [Syntrophotalea carbinolica DSM 2380]|uniref:Dephospho-CoA kinase n=1 Tax=Syntrophotalea carbinolica (strain DSM 2380 / NBRC 103641 / GraBd1) TaxID=338963 RepID=COAE_SYNC1|nr:dephospho-CoA kinase [Syntrophotalea carbinolica]Q3A6J1.1 RecName: Full=Dephospho-CoA kinase; AltName: Full=Dephosphocoenzyme A kinase [Syntrophotalea carbinolica DSM 2380]ABA88016.1 dephospho-coenzyme A kinase [Syntrophotalea carbinolica DSM 2380]